MGSGSRRTRTALHGVLGLFVAAGLLGFLFRGTDWSELGHALRGVQPGWLAVAQLLIWAGLLMRVQRWTYVVRAVHPAPYRSLLSATQIGLLVNLTVPARLGEVVRAWVLSRLVGLPVPRSLAMVAMDRVTDVIGILSVLLVAGIALARDANVVFPAGTLGNTEPFTVSGALVRSVGQMLAVVVCGVWIVLILLYVRRGTVLRLVRGGLGALSPAVAAKAAALLESFADGLHVFRSGGDLARAVLWSLASWSMDVAAVAALLTAFDVAFPWYAPFVILSFVAVAILVPVTPGLVGQFHVPAVAGMLLAIPELAPTRAKAVAIADHLSTLIPIAALGLYCLFRERLGLADVMRRSTGTGHGYVVGARSGG
jgi:uncharacterized membrane protein YbhN (UPF0104 family)